MEEVAPASDEAETLRLPRLIHTEIPATGAPIAEPKIASGFFGCWVGDPGKFSAIVGVSGRDSPSKLGRVVKCYMPGRIETEEFNLELVTRYPRWNKILSVVGLGYRRVRVKEARTAVYKTNANQIYSRGTMKLELTESSLFKWPRTTQRAVVDEEVATLVNPDLVLIAGRVFVSAAQGRSVGVWSAKLHH
ncbi:MAG TPA: hypothetical protein VKS22_00610 [Candidatus Binataceae bacterium]|nr:hypothetical protein [Candidatus Binataceae bacterium]